MNEKNLIIHSDEVKGWKDLRDPKARDEHLKIVDNLRKEEDVIEITSDQDPATAADYFRPGDKVTIFGQSSGKYGCVTRAAEALRKKGLK